MSTDSDAGQRQGARVGGATGPGVSAEHGLGAVPSMGEDGVSPEQAAGETPEEELTHGTPARYEGVGPAHLAGVPKGEDQTLGG
jgi:hypothetical protein